MKIPSSFKLLGKTITVQYDNDLRYRENCSGEARYRTNTIHLQPSSGSWPVTQESTEHTFLHELTHHILQAQGKTDLRNDEEFVDLFSGLLHQALTTMEYKQELS